MVKKVKIGIAKSQPKYKCYHLDDKDTLFFEDGIVVPKGDLRKVIMNKAHNSLLYPPWEHEDVSGPQADLLVDSNEARDCSIRE